MSSSVKPHVPAEFHYRIPWRSQSGHPGFHRSSQSGGEQEFYGHAPLMSRPEPRNIDIHASLLDPFGQFVVRTFRQRGIINVSMLADLSASMGFMHKMQVLADLTAATGYSCFRTQDHFGFYGCDEKLRTEFFVPNRWHKGGVPDLAEQLRNFRPSGKNCQALQQNAEFLPWHRSLIFLVSDFHFPLPQIRRLMDSLSRHDVLPIVLWQQQEYKDLPEWGLCRLLDPETRRSKNLLMRPNLKQKIQQAFLQRKQQLRQLFVHYGRQPFFISDRFQADHLTRYFYEQ